MTTTNQYNWKLTGYVATIVIILTIPLSLLLNRHNEPVTAPVTVFTGGKACVECHQKEYRLWKGSDHDNAMAVATDSTVEGDFNNAVFTYGGKQAKFYKRDGKFYVFTEGPGGTAKEFQITHTFGIHPLQQYLIPFENGKYQCLPIAWNTLQKKWFHMAGMVYKPEDLKPDNWLYWTNQAQNWNSMCAECHSTNLQKNFDLATKSYHTTWVDININCEACHGPGSAHIEWARLPEMGRPQDNNAGLVVKTSKISSRQYVESCAPCHARRSSFGPYDHSHSEFSNYAAPQLPTTPAYHIDGQFKDEDYEYASFTQSKMYMKDVRCGDCHDAHSLKRKFEGNALCLQCHKADDYNGFNHHFHKQKGETGTSFVNKRGERLGPGDGSLCRDCHMPGQYYMGVDKRFDHSLRIPRPDLSIKLGTPNACINCHDDKTNEWALQFINKWYGEKKKPHYGTILADAFAGKAGADSGLLKIINSNLYPEIIRATAIGYLAAYQSPKAREAVQRALNDPDPLLRRSAAENIETADSATLFRSLAPLLNDPIRSVRMEAANQLITFRKSTFNEIQYKAFLKDLDEYRQSQEYVADFPSARYNLGNYYMKLNDINKAEENYREALTIDNLFFPAKNNLAMIYYREGKTDQAIVLFKDMIANNPGVTEGYYYLALVYGEMKRYDEAIALLETASGKSAAHARIFYNLGLLYQMTGQLGKSESTLAKGVTMEPQNYDLLYALCTFYLQQKQNAKAAVYAQRIAELFPQNPVGKQLLQASSAR